METGSLTETWRVARSATVRSFGRKAAGAGFALMLALASVAYQAPAQASSGGATVQGLYDTLLSTMKSGSTLGGSGRYTQLAPVIRRSFDLPFMARLAFGPGWAGLTQAQQQQVAQSYGRYISAVYADRFDSYHGQRLDVTGERQNPYGLIVTSQIIKSDGDPVEVDYLMRQAGGNWLIADIYLDGTISEVATHRSEFADILRNQGVDGLIEALNRKADMLTGTTASAS
ncbi:MAG: ABC transporter substrate-binding protein [Stellaceae bacterium]